MNKNRKFSLYRFGGIVFISSILVYLLSGCMGMKSGAGKSGKELFITFFTSDQSTQYFIKPLEFTNNKKESIACDFTFKNKNNAEDSATINVSIVALTLLKNIDSLAIENKVVRVVLTESQVLYNERQKDFFNSRFSFKIRFSDLNKLFDNNEWKIIYYSGQNSGEFLTQNKTKSKLQKLSYQIFDLF